MGSAIPPPGGPSDCDPEDGEPSDCEPEDPELSDCEPQDPEPGPCRNTGIDISTGEKFQLGGYSGRFECV